MHNIIKQKSSFDSLNVDSPYYGKGKFLLPTLRRYSSTTNLHQQENVNTPQILQRSLSSIFKKIPKSSNNNEKRENDTNSIDDDNSSITSSDSSSIDDVDTKSNNKLISMFSGALKGNSNFNNNNNNRRKKYNFNEIIVSNEIIITTTDTKDLKDDENDDSISPSRSFTTYETHLQTPTHNYSFYYPHRSKSVPSLPKLKEEFSQLSRHGSVKERDLPNLPNDNNNISTISIKKKLSSFSLNVSQSENTLSSIPEVKVLKNSASTTPLDSPNSLNNKEESSTSSSPLPITPSTPPLPSLPFTSNSPPLPPIPPLPPSSSPLKESIMKINDNNNNTTKIIKTNIPKITTTNTEMETWPFSRFPLRSAFYNLSDSPPCKTLSNNNNNIVPIRSRSKNSPPSKSILTTTTTTTTSSSSSSSSSSVIIPSPVKTKSNSYEPNYYNYGLCEKCKKPRTGILWCQSCYTEIFQKNFCNWTSGSKEIDEFIKESQLNSNNICELIEWIPFEKFRDLQLIGEGGYGIVYLAKWIDGRILDLNEDGEWERTGENDVILKIFYDSKDLSQEYLNELESYRKSTSKLNHVLKCYGISKDPFAKNTIMVMEYAKDGNLKDHLKKNIKDFTWVKRISMLNDISRSLKSIHSAGLIHKNLHSGNVLIHDNNAFISDLGLCTPKIKNDNSTSLYGVIPYVAPEILKGNQFTMNSDIYGFGMIMYELATSLPPYHDYSSDENLLRDICDGIRPKILEGIPNCYVELMNKCLSENPEDRPNMDYINQIIEDWKKNNLEDFNNIAEQFRLNQIEEIEKIHEKLLRNYKSKELPKFVVQFK